MGGPRPARLRTDLPARRELSLDQHAVEDAIERNELPKATRYSTHLFMTTCAINYDPNLFAENAKSAREVSREAFQPRHSLVEARRAILPMREVVNTTMRRVTGDGFYGQNVPYPGFGHESGFIFSTATTVLIALGLYVTFRRKDWL
jgi:magnesium transporter